MFDKSNMNIKHANEKEAYDSVFFPTNTLFKVMQYPITQ